MCWHTQPRRCPVVRPDGNDSRLMLGGLLRCRCLPDLDAMGNHFFVHLHGVDDDPVADLDIGLLNRLLGALVSCHLRVEADFNGFSRRCLNCDGCIRNLGHRAGHVLFAAVRDGDCG